MSAIVAKKDITLRMVHNKVSTAFTKAFLESDYVKEMVHGLKDGVDALRLVSISLNYVYRCFEYKKYLERYNQVRLMTKRGEKNTPIILEMNDSVFDFRAHTSLKRCAKYDTKDHKHEGLNVYKLIKDKKLEMANAKLSYSKASSKDMHELIKETIRILDVLFCQFDQIEAKYEKIVGNVSSDGELEYIQLYGSFAEKNTRYNKSFLVSHCEYKYSHDKYAEVKKLLLGLDKEVRSRKKENREER